MYTQCPDCGTVFKVTADALRAAQGTVRCGICSSSFSALEYLSEEPLLRRQDEASPADDSMTVEELPGTEFIELSSAGEAAAQDAAESGDRDGEADDAGGLEFSGSAEDLDRLFVEQGVEPFGRGASGVDDLDQSIGEIAEADLSGIEVIEGSLTNDAEGDAANPGRIAAVLAFRRPGDGGVPDDPLSRAGEYPIVSLDATDEDGEKLQILIPEELRRAAADGAPAADAFAAVDAADARHGRRWPLVVGLLVLLLALAAQAVHFWRDELVRNPLAGPWLLQAYAAAGLPLQPPADLSAFELRQLGAANDPIQVGRLKVRASIVNNAPFAQPYPLLRLSLQDRFGTTVGVRNLEPAEYLPGGSEGTLLGPSRRADAEIVFVDPGRDAVGYELDVCLRDAAGIRCSTDLNGRRP